MHFFQKNNKSILCSYSGFLSEMVSFFRDKANLRITFHALHASLDKVFATFSLGSDACRIILHQLRFASLFASNFCAFRSICSSTNSLPSSEYIFQRDWAIIFIQIAYLMNRLHIEISTSGARPSLQMPQISQKNHLCQLNLFLCEFRCSRKKSWKK